MTEGERIRRIRVGAGLGLEYVAKGAGISKSFLSRLENGTRQLSYQLAVRLARVLGCDVNAFDDGFGGPLRTVVAGQTLPPA